MLKLIILFCALDITENESVVWKETSPNHPLTHQPLMLQMGKESETTLQSLKIFNDDIRKVRDDGITITKNDIDYVIKVDIISHARHEGCTFVFRHRR